MTQETGKFSSGIDDGRSTGTGFSRSHASTATVSVHRIEGGRERGRRDAVKRGRGREVGRREGRGRERGREGGMKCERFLIGIINQTSKGSYIQYQAKGESLILNSSLSPSEPRQWINQHHLTKAERSQSFRTPQRDKAM